MKIVVRCISSYVGGEEWTSHTKYIRTMMPTIDMHVEIANLICGYCYCSERRKIALILQNRNALKQTTNLISFSLLHFHILHLVMT